MPAGHNGPHNDIETPVRATSHWLIAFLKAHEISRMAEFRQAAWSCLRYLLSKQARPMDATFWHRKNPKKDFSNGLMGQAWTIESLVYAYRYFKEDEILELAEQVFFLHPYSREIQAWKSVNVDGSIRGFDFTFNHQLWFASMGLELMDLGVTSVSEPVNHFLSRLHDNIDTYSDGVIRHYPYGYARPKKVISGIGMRVQKMKDIILPNKHIYLHSVGYHAFNTYALYVISLYRPDLEFFRSHKFEKILTVLKSSNFRSLLNSAPFGFPYNPPGLEIAVSLQMQNGTSEDIRTDQKHWIKEQFSKTFDFQNFTMSRNTPDPVTYEARLYEAYRLTDFSLEVEPV